MASWHDDWIAASEAGFYLRDRTFYDEQMKITSEAIMHEALQSSGVGVMLYQSLDAEVASRATLLLDQFRESVAAQSILSTEDLEGLDERAEAALKRTYDHLFNQTRISSYLVQFALHKVREDSELNLKLSVERMKIKIRLAGEAAMKKQAEETKNVTNVTIHGHGNVVQAGINQSTVGLKFDQTTVQSLSSALEELREAIDKSDAPLELKAELTEVTSDCRTELQKSAPNRMKFTALLGGLASGIQTVASMKDAWEVFKAVAVIAGIAIL